MRLPFLGTVALLVGVGGCGAGPSSASSVKSPRAAQAGSASLAHRAAKAAPTRKAVPRAEKAEQRPQSAKPVARADIAKLAALWSNRRAISCEILMKIDQGGAQGRVVADIAWVNPSTQDPAGLISAKLSGQMLDQKCSYRLRSAKDALLMEAWQPQVRLSSMQQLPSSMVPEKIQSLRQLEVPMVQALILGGCASLFKLPGAQKAMWTLQQASQDRVAWQGPGGASQLLVLDATGMLPKQRILEFADPSGAKVRWTMDLDCQSAG